MSQENFETWAVVEISGHVAIAGYVTEAQIAGHGFVRVDVPKVADGKPAYTRYVEPQFIYSLTPCDEKMARLFALQRAVPPRSLTLLTAGNGNDYEY